MKPPTRPPGLAAVLGDEGLRLFFPLAALHAALWPFLWAALLGFDLPLARSVPPALWHAHEMILGAFGGALIGFLTTAIPEWTDTARPRGRTLFVLAAIWGLARLIGLPGADALGMVAALADIAWLGWLIVFAIRVSLARRTERLLAFIGWLAALPACEIAIRAAFLTGDIAMAQDALRIAGLVFLGLLGLALARITTPITNLVLDPSEETAPFRPHPGRLNLAPGLLALLIAGEIAGLSPAVTGYLAIGAGAAFLDRV
ncbi:MAG: NnrS family protein, partial [Rhabdaerophilum calidifontis]